ncbi:MAG: hypothetical protein ACTSVI_01685 [Promethearchaeota archaeon]
MIENVYIILESGVSIYSYSSPTGITIDENLITAFLTALNQFALETFQESNLEKIDISNKKKLVYYNPSLDDKIKHESEPRQKLNIYAVTNYLDHPRLTRSILRKIYVTFTKKFHDKLANNTLHEVGAFSSFDEDINRMLKRKVYHRTKKNQFFGLMVSFGIILASLIVFTALNSNTRVYSQLEQYLSEEQAIKMLLTFMSLSNIVLSVSGIIGGYIAGSRKLAVKNGVFTTGIIMLALTIISIRNGLPFLVINFFFIVYFSLNAMFSCYLGGFLRDQRFFYP